MSNRIHVRWMTRADMDDVLEIERLSFDDGWNRETFLTELRKKNQIGLVAECCGEVMGFMIYDLARDRINLVNFAVHPMHRRKGVGNGLMAKVMAKLSPRRPRIGAVVHERFMDAQLFLRSQGFRATKVLRGEYGPDDGYEMAISLPEPAVQEGMGS